MELTKYQAKVETTTSLPVYRPSHKVAFRIRPDASSRHDFTVIELMSGEVYLVSHEIAHEIRDVAKPKSLFVAVDETGSTFILPITCWTGTGKPTSWSMSGANIVAKAKIAWVTMQSDRANFEYRALIVSKPIEPHFPEASFDALLDEAFRDRVIDTLDHPAIAQARSEKSR